MSHWSDDCPIAEYYDDEQDTWCNCQAIPGTQNYPGPWHERAGESHYPCYNREGGR